MLSLDKHGPRALITGASSGIGEALARQLAERGFDLVLVARRGARLAQLCETLPVDVHVVVADLSEDEGVQKVLNLDGPLQEQIGTVVNNAGFGMKGPMHTLDVERQQQMVRLNCEAPVRIAHHFARRLHERKKGALVFTSSTAAFQGIPHSATYAASKGFTLQLAEGLHFELAPEVDVLAVCPGAVDTEGPPSTGVDVNDLPVKPLTADEVARAIIDHVGRGPIVVPGAVNKLGAMATRLFPRAFAANLAGRMIQKAQQR